jgi:DNA-binding CsgD family transcriptional regulator
VPIESCVFFPYTPARTPVSADHRTIKIPNEREVASSYGARFYALGPLQVLNDPRNANQPRRYSDVTTARAQRNTEFYSDFLRPLDIAKTLGCSVAAWGQPTGGMGVHRPGQGPDFSDRDVTVLALIGPHLARALRSSGFTHMLDGDNACMLERLHREYALTPRESQIVDLLLRGLSNCEISGRLSITEQTVKDHLRTVYDKCGVRSRTPLMAPIFRAPEASPPRT